MNTPSNAALPDRDLVQRAPKVVLHEHLDGSLRPSTVLELAEKAGYGELPESDPDKLADWFAAGAARGSLPLYLEGFRHTIAVMQSAETLERVAYEYIEDQARDNVVYAEVRFAPVFHTQEGLGLDGVMTSVLRGLQRGSKDFDVGFGLIVCAMRNASSKESREMAELAVAYRDQGCVGFDLAGEEAGHPAKHHLDAFHFAQRQNFSITIHAGESFGPESIWQALQYCGAHRIGHGTRLIEDMVVVDGEIRRLGPLAQYVLDRRTPLELCLSSNVHTAATPSIEEHPFPHFLENGFRITLNTDNRLMSRTTMTDECMVAVNTFGCTLKQIEKLTINAMKSAFAHHDERLKFIFDRIKPGYTALYKEA
jgi:adenosine deaminase